MGKKKQDRKINVESMSGSSTLFNNAFASLSSDGLPEGKIIEPTPEQQNSSPQPSKKEKVILRKETAQRGGKTVIVISGFEKTEDLPLMLKDLKKKYGCGGIVKEKEIEIQGNLVSQIRDFFSEKGYRVAGITE